MTVDPKTTAKAIALIALIIWTISLIVVSPGILGTLMLIIHSIDWLQSGEWNARSLADYINADFLRSSRFVGWNKIVDAVFSYPAWLVGISTSFLLWLIYCFCFFGQQPFSLAGLDYRSDFPKS